MKLASRTTISLLIIAVTLVAALTWSLWFLVDATDDADRAAADARLAGMIVEHIEQLRPAGTKGAFQESIGVQLPRLLDSAIKSADIDAENLTRISPQPARRLGLENVAGQAGLKEVPVQLVFRQLPLRQLLTFLTTLLQANNGLCVRDLHLSFPADANEATANWNVELTVSYITASPTGQALPVAASAD